MAKNRLQSKTDKKSVVARWDLRDLVLSWHQLQLGLVNTASIVAVMGIFKHNKIIGSVIYQRYRHPDIEIGIFTTDRAWCTRHILNQCFSYPFETLGCKRVTAITDPSTPEVCQLIKRLGFVEEGRLRNALPHSDALLLGMLANECRWI